jgi:excisionase family DNA binding protein
MKLLTVPGAADRAGLAEVTLWKWIRSGRIGSTKLGRSRRIPESELRRLIERGWTPALDDEGSPSVGVDALPLGEHRGSPHQGAAPIRRRAPRVPHAEPRP